MAEANAKGRATADTQNDRSSRRRRSGRPQRPDAKETAEAIRPDVSELRRLREAYFGGGRSAHGRSVKTQTVRSGTSKPRSEHGTAQSASRAKSRVKTRYVQRERVTSRPRDRTAEYVYRNHNQYSVRKNSTSARSSRFARVPPSDISQSSRSTSPELPEEELIPDDSISQVAERAARRPAIKRTTLRPIAEKSAAPTATESLGTKRKRTSGFWSSVFKRQQSSTAPPPKHVECLTCGSDNIPAARAIKLDCGHRMCHSCLRRIFKLAVHDPAHMPPRCCTADPIPLKHVGPLFDLRFKMLFNKKFDEYNTKNRIYCPNRRCGVWIRPSSFVTSGGRKHARCPRCNTRACIHCGQKLHKSVECPKDPEIAKLVAQAAEQGWKRCYNCNAMVELKEGCNHMTCRCLAEFCMLCGKRWKTCDCPWFNHSNLPDLDRLNDMIMPQPIEVVVRRVRAFNDAAAPQRPRAEEGRVPRRARTHREELSQRRRQELDDEDLARRMQFADI